MKTINLELGLSWQPKNKLDLFSVVLEGTTEKLIQEILFIKNKAKKACIENKWVRKIYTYSQRERERERERAW